MTDRPPTEDEIKRVHEYDRKRKRKILEVVVELENTQCINKIITYKGVDMSNGLITKRALLGYIYRMHDERGHRGL